MVYEYLNILLSSILNPPILFFFVGAAAALLGVPLRIPDTSSKFFALYLLFSIGLKGGAALRTQQLTPDILIPIGIGLGLAFLVPFYVFFIARLMSTQANAAAIAATYGSVSVVTYLTATQYLERTGSDNPGYMVGVMALMEVPAIIVGLALSGKRSNRIQEILKESILNPSVFLLLSAFLVGLILPPANLKPLDPFIKEIFVGFLCFFLLDLGLTCADNLKTIKVPKPMLLVGLAVPILNACVALFICKLLSVSPVPGFILMVLAASASYIAVPAALKLSLPEADVGLYLPLSLGVTFPFNITLGLPLYFMLATIFL